MEAAATLCACFGWPAEWRLLLRKWCLPLGAWSECKLAIRLLHTCLQAGELKNPWRKLLPADW